VKVVADANVLISAYAFPGGAPEKVLRAAIDGRIRLGTTTTLLAELARVLADKSGWEAAAVEAVIEQLGRVADVVQAAERVREIKADPADDRVLEAALAHGAEAIVTGDGHLRSLGTWREIEVLSPSELAARLE
jgi:putative PIN family toxin of toxin-antitoxin system